MASKYTRQNKHAITIYVDDNAYQFLKQLADEHDVPLTTFVLASLDLGHLYEKYRSSTQPIEEDEY